MYLSKNLQTLRRRDKITQEELADRLGVSRQSVSKWETDEAYPETDKLLALCDMFDVSLDALMRSEISDATPEEKTEEKPDEPRMTKAEFAAHFNKFSVFTALGVVLIILGVAFCVMISGFADGLKGRQSDIAGVMAGVCVLLFTAAAVFLFIYFGMSHDKFKRSIKSVPELFDDSETSAFNKRFAVAVACLVSGIILDVIFLVVLSALLENGIIKSDNANQAQCFIVSAFLAILALLVGGLVFFGIQHQKYNAKTYIDLTQTEPVPRIKKILDSICGAIMLTATAIYLMLGFVWDLWHPSWVVFPVGGIICAIICTISRGINKD